VNDTCPMCSHSHQSDECLRLGCDCDYEECGYCGFDHSYAPEEARRWHEREDPEGKLYETNEGKKNMYKLTQKQLRMILRELRIEEESPLDDPDRDGDDDRPWPELTVACEEALKNSSVGIVSEVKTNLFDVLAGQEDVIERPVRIEDFEQVAHGVAVHAVRELTEELVSDVARAVESWLQETMVKR